MIRKQQQQQQQKQSKNKATTTKTGHLRKHLTKNGEPQWYNWERIR